MLAASSAQSQRKCRAYGALDPGRDSPALPDWAEVWRTAPFDKLRASSPGHDERIGRTFMRSELIPRPPVTPRAAKQLLRVALRQRNLPSGPKGRLVAWFYVRPEGRTVHNIEFFREFAHSLFNPEKSGGDKGHPNLDEQTIALEEAAVARRARMSYDAGASESRYGTQ
jgi:hypothetical protein